MKTIWISGLAAMAMAFYGTTAAAQSAEYAVMRVHLDNVRNATSPIRVLQDCASNELCAGLLVAAGQYFGVPPAVTIAAAATITSTRDGEGTYMNFGLPPGYAYCRAEIGTFSIVPHDGDRGSTFLARADPNGMYVETWTPVQPPFAGRSWVEVDVTILGVRQDLAAQKREAGFCHPPTGRNILYCRGGGCGPTVDRGQSVPSSSPPPAGGRN